MQVNETVKQKDRGRKDQRKALMQRRKWFGKKLELSS